MNLFNILFGGCSPTLLKLSNGTITSSTGPIATASIRFNTDGSTEQGINGVYSTYNSGEWFVPEPRTGVGSDYEVSLISFTGFAPSGMTVGVWYDLGTAREATRSTSASGTRSANCTFGLRKAGSTITLVTAVITLQTILP